LYEAGMHIPGKRREAMLDDYVPFEGFEKASASGVIECIPKLTQALLVPREVVRERRGSVDDYLFPLLPEKEAPVYAQARPSTGRPRVHLPGRRDDNHLLCVLGLR
jgi:hypothetical protein